ncbi:Carboxyl-terminal protease [Arcticibacter svalbardensis MN12-7]|uniref:Carboxyl-terminal protease n=1 Tax=Arcticibacter svalbardensis MN12-7 TaxID=1150600 RepID=R9GQ73_9SPHI|nr:S41 family peptidase [Arcticibacter svalbardensis]EOR93655.1 Carboxyl-terminal protease [Arcticibacter svalbardensis MN12-7]
MNKKKAKSLTSILSVAVIALSIITGCKKDKETNSSRVELITDSVFLYAKEVYLWNTSLPTYDAFNPRKYVQTDEEAGFNQELFAITRYPINSATGLSYEYNLGSVDDTKYSFISNTDDDNPIAFVGNAQSSVDLEGNGYDLGIDITLDGTAKNYTPYVTAVAHNSPAEKAGIKRGDKITSINGTAVGSNFYGSEEDLLNNTFFNNTVSPATLKGTTRDGTALNVTLNVSSYKSTPIICDTVYTAGAKKIGYLAYSAFTTPTNSESALAEVFTNFATAGVTDLIIDLRYNGGGYVSTAQYLANLIAPSSINGSVMFTEHYNTMMQEKKATILKNLPYRDDNDKIQYSNGRMKTYYDDIDYTVAGNTTLFAKKGSLSNIRNVVFIVTSSTASASELVINSLKPYMNVQLVGEQSYGKPVGFFPIKIDKYDVYLSMFESRNKEDKADYYAGFTPDALAKDNYSYLLGDKNENSINAAYQYLVDGVFPVSTSSTTSSMKTSRGAVLKAFEAGNKKLPAKGFRGMIEDRIKAK